MKILIISLFLICSNAFSTTILSYKDITGKSNGGNNAEMVIDNGFGYHYIDNGNEILESYILTRQAEDVKSVVELKNSEGKVMGRLFVTSTANGIVRIHPSFEGISPYFNPKVMRLGSIANVGEEIISLNFLNTNNFSGVEALVVDTKGELHLSRLGVNKKSKLLTINNKTNLAYNDFKVSTDNLETLKKKLTMKELFQGKKVNTRIKIGEITNPTGDYVLIDSTILGADFTNIKYPNKTAREAKLLFLKDGQVKEARITIFDNGKVNYSLKNYGVEIKSKNGVILKAVKRVQRRAGKEGNSYFDMKTRFENLISILKLSPNGNVEVIGVSDIVDPVVVKENPVISSGVRTYPTIVDRFSRMQKAYTKLQIFKAANIKSKGYKASAKTKKLLRTVKRIK